MFKKKDIDPNLDKKIEALLFFKGEEMNLKFLSKNLIENKGRIKEAVEKLKERLIDSALVLVENNNSYLLTTRSDFSDVIKSLIKEEGNTDLSKPALEALSIILYKGPIAKAGLDEIRGINSAYILRNLLIRGLIEKKMEGGRNIYSPSMDLLRFVGVENQKSLPAYEEVLEKIRKIEENGSFQESLI